MQADGARKSRSEPATAPSSRIGSRPKGKQAPVRGTAGTVLGELLQALWSNVAMHGSTAGLMARIGLTLFSCLSALIDTPSYAQSVVLQRHDVDQWRTNQIIVKWRAEGVAAVQMPKVTDRALRLSELIDQAAPRVPADPE